MNVKGNKHEIHSVKDKPFYWCSVSKDAGKLDSLQQLLSHMATVMMMIIEEGEEAASERGGGKGEEATSEDIYKKLKHVKTFTDI